jgi:hypothetical protein
MEIAMGLICVHARKDGKESSVTWVFVQIVRMESAWVLTTACASMVGKGSIVARP